MKASDAFQPIPSRTSVDGITYLRPAAGWDRYSPGGCLMPAIESTDSSTKKSRYFSASARNIQGVNSFGLVSVQRYLRGVFDSLGVRDLNEAEARDAFLAGPEETALMLSQVSKRSKPFWVKLLYKMEPSGELSIRKRDDDDDGAEWLCTQCDNVEGVEGAVGGGESAGAAATASATHASGSSSASASTSSKAAPSAASGAPRMYRSSARAGGRGASTSTIGTAAAASSDSP